MFTTAGFTRAATSAKFVAYVYTNVDGFRVSYEAVDQDLPALIAREKPQAFVMFGLAGRTKHVRIETRARNVLTRVVPDADGQIPVTATIVPGAPMALSLRAPAHRLLMAARATGVPVALSGTAQDPVVRPTRGYTIGAVVGTVLLVLGSMAIALVLGVISAIYLSEYAKDGPFIRFLRLSIVNLAGVPSIVLITSPGSSVMNWLR